MSRKKSQAERAREKCNKKRQEIAVYEAGLREFVEVHALFPDAILKQGIEDRVRQLHTHREKLKRYECEAFALEYDDRCEETDAALLAPFEHARRPALSQHIQQIVQEIVAAGASADIGIKKNYVGNWLFKYGPELHAIYQDLLQVLKQWGTEVTEKPQLETDALARGKDVSALIQYYEQEKGR